MPSKLLPSNTSLCDQTFLKNIFLFKQIYLQLDNNRKGTIILSPSYYHIVYGTITIAFCSIIGRIWQEYV